MIDREKVTAVLDKRFPHASRRDIAEAANAIVGLEPEYEPIDVAGVRSFKCVAGPEHFTLDDLAIGRLRVLRRLAPADTATGTKGRTAAPDVSASGGVGGIPAADRTERIRR